MPFHSGKAVYHCHKIKNKNNDQDANENYKGWKVKQTMQKYNNYSRAMVCYQLINSKDPMHITDRFNPMAILDEEGRS